MPILGAQGSTKGPSTAPTIGTATAGNGTASVTFTAPSFSKLPITSYTVTSSPGNITGTGASSPITVSGLSNGTAYTFTVRATHANGQSAASASSNSVTPLNPISVSGGTLTDDATYYYRTFTGNGTLSVSGGTLIADCLTVSSGGGGGSGNTQFPRGVENRFVGGGGGGGGVIYSANASVASANYTITIGGAGFPGDPVGQSSSFSITGSPTGGGIGGGSPGNGSDGGSGGGAGQRSNQSISYTGGNPTSGQGNRGGNTSIPNSVLANTGAGGGGGAGAVGSNASNGAGGNGGSGVTYFGVTVGGGGGGGGVSSGGAGGGGGATNGSTGDASNAGANTGGGAGGGGASGTQKNALSGSGVVIIRYTRSQVGG